VGIEPTRGIFVPQLGFEDRREHQRLICPHEMVYFTTRKIISIPLFIYVKLTAG